MTLVAHRWKSRAKFVWYRSDAAQARRAQLCCHLAPQVARLLQPHHSTAEPRALARFATARLGARRVAAEHGAAEHVAAELGAAEHSAAKSIAAKCVAVGGADGHSPGERVACSQHGRAEHDPAEHGPAEHGPAEHGPGEHGAAKHGTAIAREQSTPLPQLRSTSPWLLCALHSASVSESEGIPGQQRGMLIQGGMLQVALGGMHAQISMPANSACSAHTNE